MSSHLVQRLPEDMRALLHRTSFAVLGSMYHEDSLYPYCSMVQYVIDDNGEIIFQTANISEHLKNLQNNRHISLYVADANAAVVGTAATPRLTLVGQCKRIEDKEVRYSALERFRKSPYPIPEEIEDTFILWHISIIAARWISGFGRMGKL